MPAACVTTSWDDGGEGDARIGEMLADRGMKGTFYWPVAADHPHYRLPSRAVAADLLAAGMEIGSHTVTHPILTRVPTEQVHTELRESKARLEEHIDRPVDAFCYPAGYYDRRIRDATEAAGYRLARTTDGMRIDTRFDPFLMPVTVQLFPHGRRVHLTHSLRRRNLRGLFTWTARLRVATDLMQLTEAALDLITETGGMFHLWGHSWELDEHGLWPTLEVLLDRIAERPGVRHVTNTEAVAALLPEGR